MEMEKKNSLVPTEPNCQNRIEEWKRRATKDALSGLLNRAALEYCVRARLEDMGPGETCALFIVDLDDFKRVNDTLGHQAGDKAICQAAKVLSRVFCARDVVGRLGGDEFAAFLWGNITEEVARSKAAEICANLQLALGDRRAVTLTASVGVYLAGKGQKFEGLYHSADLAMYKAKNAGKHQYYLKNGVSHREGPSGDYRPVNAILLSELLENMGSGVALLEMGEAPQVIYVSPSFCSLIGADVQAFPLPKLLGELIHPDDLLPLVEILRAGLSSGGTVEHSHRVAAGRGCQWLWWHVKAMRIEYDAPNPVMLITAMDISQFKETQQRQEDQIRRLQAALNQTSKRLWEVDMATGVFRSYSRDGKLLPLGEENAKFPEQLIAGGWIHPNSVARFRLFAQELLGGCVQGFGNFAVRNRGNSYYSWASVSYRMLFDDLGRATRAVGVLEELPRGFGTMAMWPAGQQDLPESLVADLVLRMRANLDLDTVELLWEEGSDLSGQVQEARCSQVLQVERQKVFGKGDQKALKPHFDRERLLEEFEAGRRWLCGEYRRVDSGGGIRWVRHVLYMAQDPVSRQRYLFAYLIWLDPDRRMEPHVRGENLRDPVTRLYSRETLRRIAEGLFARRGGGNRAVVVLQVYGLDPWREKDPAGADRSRYEIAAALSLVMGGGCVLGQHGPAQYVLLFPAVPSKEELRRRIEEGLACMRKMLGPERAYQALRFVFGAALLSAESARYEAMLTQALRVCSLQEDSTADTVAFAQEMDDWGWAQLSPRPEDSQGTVRSTELDRPLSTLEKDVAFDCVATMLTAKTLDASINGVLKTIGTYYHADRVYTLNLVGDRRAVVMAFEWTSPGRRSIQQVVSGMSLKRFPLLERCLGERAPLFLSRNGGGGKEGAPEKPWYFTVFPLAREGQVEGFLCIENAREHPEDAALFGTLIPYMLLERERFHGNPGGVDPVTRLMDLPDRQPYREIVQTLTSERFSSLGAVCLDIPHLSEAGGLGYEKDSKLLWYVAKNLTDLFGPALSFRVWDTEFVAFFPNTTREVFVGRCGRLRSILQRRYPKQVRLGRAWAQGTFTGARLVEEARAAMRISSGTLAAEVREFAENAALAPAPEGKMARAGQRFTIYLQPKLNIRTGALSGAEVLVRGVGEDGSIVPPSQFIELLEEEGAIRDLDLLVLERALSLVDQWRRAGLGVVPVAVNLSRVTLAHPSTLASVLALQSRYPHLPPEALELEITERGEGVDNEELRQIEEEYHACGLRLSLDDFGSKYANLPLFTNVKFDTVKLDRGLIAEVVQNPISRTLVGDIIQICQEFHMACVVEGVETGEQAAALLEMGCDLAQGFYFDRPLPIQEFERKYLHTADPAARENKKEERL